MSSATRSERRKARKRFEADLAGLAERLGATAEDAEGLLDVLPYSKIPDVSDAHLVLDWLGANRGWERLAAREDEA